MSAPDRPKRPSARPPRRATLPPPPDFPVEVQAAPEVQVAPEVQAAPLESGKKRPAARPSPQTKPTEQVEKPSRARVSARRASQAPSAPEQERKGRRSMPSAPKESARAVAPSQEPPVLSEENPALSDDDDDIWRDSAPVLDLAQPSRAVLVDTNELAREQRVALKPASRLARGASAEEPASEAALIGSAQSLLSTDYYFRQYGAHGMRSLSAEVDEFGLDPHVEERARPSLELLCKRYFRVTVDGAQHLPAAGRALMVANRAGTLPWDGLVLRTALRLQRPELPPVRWLSEDSVFHYPFLGVFMNRLGAVRACQENAERLLSQDKLVAAFPEGAQGSRKLFKDRYQLQRFGRGGYIKLALKLAAPILPTAIIGAEETNPVLARSRILGRVVGTESFPFTPTFPWLGPLGLLPAPVKWRIVVGEPIDLSSYGPDAADDALLVHRLNEQVRGILQDLLKQGTASRRSTLFG